MKESKREFLNFTVKVIITHTISYFIFGLIFSNLFDYASLFQEDIISDFMRPIDSGFILAGPLLQPVRGILFAFAIWPIRSFIMEKKYGWLYLWNILLIFGILSTPAAAPCSIEGILYTKLPLSFHLIGLPEILLQTLSFSFVLIWWLKKDQVKQDNLEISPLKKKITYLVLCIMLASFAYVGYAIGSIIVAKIVGVKIDIQNTSVNVRSQMMFVSAFVVNIVALYTAVRQWIRDRITMVSLFFLFWFIDSASIFIYQILFTSPMPIYFILLIGFFPALIIIWSLWMNRTKFIQLSQ